MFPLYSPAGRLNSLKAPVLASIGKTSTSSYMRVKQELPYAGLCHSHSDAASQSPVRIIQTPENGTLQIGGSWRSDGAWQM